MNFSPADLTKTIQRGIGPQDPRFCHTLEQNRKRRLADQDQDRCQGALHGARMLEEFPSASAWLQAHPEHHAPIWLGHNPKTSLHQRGKQNFVKFEAAGVNRAMIFEILGKNFRRVL